MSGTRQAGNRTVPHVQKIFRLEYSNSANECRKNQKRQDLQGILIDLNDVYSAANQTRQSFIISMFHCANLGDMMNVSSIFWIASREYYAQDVCCHRL